MGSFAGFQRSSAHLRRPATAFHMVASRSLKAAPESLGRRLKVAAQVIHQCLLFHGHKGYSLELPIQQRLRDVIGWQIGDGSEEVMKLIIARDLVAERQGRSTQVP